MFLELIFELRWRMLNHGLARVRDTETATCPTLLSIILRYTMQLRSQVHPHLAE